METSCRLLAIVAIASLISGCHGDRAADRTLVIHQLQSTDTYTGKFNIDDSQLPKDAITKRSDSGSKGAATTSLEINQKYSIRVVLIPVLEDESPANDLN